MRNLCVKNFSCITHANVDFSRLTVIIGPQASGKSVICKLAYFFNSLLVEQFQQIEDGVSIEEFKNYVTEKFKHLFPVSAWGAKKFRIAYSAGLYEVSVVRLSAKSERIRITFSDFFGGQYAEILSAYDVLREKVGAGNVSAHIEAEWDIRRKMMSVIKKRMGGEFAQYQLFVPAGRSFFTNAGKAITLLDQGNLVDPIVGRFGRIFGNYRERYSYGSSRRQNHEIWNLHWKELMGGVVKVQRDKEYVESTDGRLIPFTALSSGQQELLPLLMVLSHWGGLLVDGEKQHIFIEEPEAHLFPSAQSYLVEIFAEMLGSSSGLSDLVITTHSPYVLAKVNNLAKAGAIALSDSGAKSKLVSKIVRRSAWIKQGDLAAYSIDGGCCKSIVDEEGLVDGEYLDSISDDIAREFGSLLEIEYANKGGVDA